MNWVVWRDAGELRFGSMVDGLVQPHRGSMFDRPEIDGNAIPLAGLHLVAPVTPNHFIGLWNNFHALAEKLGIAKPQFPLYFLKAPSSIIGPDAVITPPVGYIGKTLYEGELGIVIGQGHRIFGYTIVNDITAIDLLNADPSFPQWSRAKSPVGFGPIGPSIATTVDLATARVRVALNGRVRQDYPLSDMIIPPERIVELIGKEINMQPGDVIACGTSLGALPMRPGMTVEVTIDGIGTLRNVMSEAE